jgi:hypothetical protein
VVTIVHSCYSSILPAFVKAPEIMTGLAMGEIGDNTGYGDSIALLDH